MTTKQRYKNVVEWFLQNMPVAETELHYNNPYQLLVAVILSAQCTDKRVNTVTPTLFELADNPKEMAKQDAEVVREIIKPCGLSPTKSKAIVNLSKLLMEHHNGVVPASFEELEKNPKLCIKNLYNSLGLSGYQKSEPYFESYLDSKKSYQKDWYPTCSRFRWTYKQC